MFQSIFSSSRARFKYLLFFFCFVLFYFYLMFFSSNYYLFDVLFFSTRLCDPFGSQIAKKNFMRLIFWFVLTPFGSIIKFQSFAQFLVDHLSHPEFQNGYYFQWRFLFFVVIFLVGGVLQLLQQLLLQLLLTRQVGYISVLGVVALPKTYSEGNI